MADGIFEEPGFEGEGYTDPISQEEQVLPLEVIAGMGIDLAFELDDQMLGTIATQCLEAYERDKAERSEWETDFDRITDNVRGEREAKSFPWPGAANVKYPLIATAAVQFNARAYPAIVKGKDVVKPKIIGDDPQGIKRERGKRVQEHMNWQLLEDMPEWEEETDKLTMMLPVHGCVFRQVIWDQTYTRPKTTLVPANKLVVSQSAKDLESVPHFAKEFELFPHEITERMRDGRYINIDIQFDGEDEQQEQQLIECHCRYDIDDDGYEEPYIAVIHKESMRLLSLKAGFWPAGVIRGDDGIVQAVRRHVEFIKYDFMPDPEGKFLGLGFGFLLRDHSDTINTIINQLLDAATDQNTGGGFIGKGFNLPGGSLEFEPGEWKFVNTAGATLRESIVPRPTSQPSPVLFQLLGLMIEAGKELASVRDVLTGEAGHANQPATTTLAIIEQGLQVFSSIYKRVYRALGRELKLIFKLNAAYLPEQAYFNVMDSQKAVHRADYAGGDHDVVPVADPSVTTSAQRLAKAEFLNAFKGHPNVDQREIVRRQLEAAEIEDIDALMPPPSPQQQQQSAQQMQMMLRKALAEILKTEAEATEEMAAARLKKIQGDVAAREAAIETAIMSLNLGALHAGPRLGPMGGMVGRQPNPEVPVSPSASLRPVQDGMGGQPLGQPGSVPIERPIPGPSSAVTGVPGSEPIGP
ncbi:MAG: hypothetical protein AAGF20_00125 [Pseudomonadota bacterium]